MKLEILLIFSIATLATSESLAGKKLKVVTMYDEPYYFDRGNEKVGFIPELMKEIGLRLNFEYSLYTPADNRWGTEVNGKWNGMVGELIKHKDTNGVEGADLCAATLTMTSKREAVINFVKPFQDIGLTIVVKKKWMQPNDDWIYPLDFSIFRPLAVEVWVLVTCLVVVVGAVMWVINRFNPYEWGSRYNTGLATETQGNSFTIVGAFWFVFTTLQWQGYERSPRSISARVLMCFWFAFVTITMVTYTGGVVNQLFWASTVHGKDPTKSEIIDLEHLVNHGAFNYGTVKHGSTYNYLMNAKGREFDAIRSYFNTTEGKKNLVENYKDAFTKARTEKYALIMESMSAIHETNKYPCDLTTAGGIFGKRGYGMAVPHDSPYLEELHKVILDLREDGTIEDLEQKWFVDNAECWNITKIEREISKASALFVNTPKQVNITMFTGPLVLMILGIVLAILVSVAETFYFKYKGRYDPKNQHGGRKLQMDDGPDD